MSIQNPGFWLRLMWAFRYFFLVLTSMEFARQVAALDQARQISVEPQTSGNVPESTPEAAKFEPEPAPEQPVAVAPAIDPAQPVLQFLGLLQQEARFVDFLQEDVTHYGDADIGAAARIVHGGCRKVLAQYMKLEPVMEQAEQTRVSVPSEFDASEIRLTGRISGQGPFSGTLMHRGWRVADIELPTLAHGHNVRIIAPAEVEV